MYCKKCGKFIGNEADLCDECNAKAQPVFKEFEEPSLTRPAAYTYNPTPAPAPAPQPNVGLGKPIAATILGAFGFWLVYFAMILFIEEMGYGIDDYGTVFVCLLLSIAPCILSLIFGIHSIKAFKAVKGRKNAKAIVSLVLGINAVVFAAIGLFLIMYVFAMMGLLESVM